MIPEEGEEKNQFFMLFSKALFYLMIILYISYRVVNQNIQFFFALPRLSIEMNMTLSIFMYNLFLFSFFETMTFNVYVAISSLLF